MYSVPSQNPASRLLLPGRKDGQVGRFFHFAEGVVTVVDNLALLAAGTTRCQKKHDSQN
jgi:hypothetical protein